MTVIEVARTHSDPAPIELFRKLISNRCCLDLLRFFMLHPEGRFSELAIVHSQDDSARRSEVDNALKQLLFEGVLYTRVENGICYYQLTREEPKRQMFLNMAKLDWSQWQAILNLL